MGEFEQAKPIIAELRRRYADIQIIVSFFSPSGYDHSKSYKHADVITYIPFDTPAEAKRFVATVKPTAAVMVRYDVWPNHIWRYATLMFPFISRMPLWRRNRRAVFPCCGNFTTRSTTRSITSSPSRKKTGMRSNSSGLTDTSGRDRRYTV